MTHYLSLALWYSEFGVQIFDFAFICGKCDCLHITVTLVSGRSTLEKHLVSYLEKKTLLFLCNTALYI